MKRYLFSLLCVVLLWGNKTEAQIALDYTDTTLCPGQTIQMCAALTGHADELFTDDQYSDVIDIGFPFVFFGKPYTKLVASGNAFVTFDTTLANPVNGPWYYSQAGYPGQVNNCIFAAFADWYLIAGGKIRYEHFGSPGSRKFIIEWCQIPMFIGVCQSAILTTQLILYEGTNVIEVHTTQLPPTPSGGCPAASVGEPVVQGIQDPSGTNTFFPVNKDPFGPLASNWGTAGVLNDAERFTPDPTNANNYIMDSTIPFNPWIIIDSLSSPDLKWYAPGQPNVPIATGACVTVTPDGSQNYYTVAFHGNAGCENDLVNLTDTVHIHYGTAYDTANAVICEGETYPFFGRNLYQSGQYDTLFSSALGCDSFVVLNLTVNPLPDVAVNSDKNLELCDGDSIRIALTNPEATSTYQWSKDGAPVGGETNPEIILKEQGSYTVTATSDSGCTATSDAVILTVHPNPDATIMPLEDEIICAYDTLSLSAVSGGGYDYRWTPEKPFRAVSGPEGQKVSGVFLEPTEVVLTVYNQFGCHDMDSAFVQTKPCCDVFVPSAFSPNGDGTNDYFQPHLQPGQILTTMKVFNRLGQLVYNNDDLQKGWNGKFQNGQDAPSDTYMYYIEYTCADGKIYNKKESITLVR